MTLVAFIGFLGLFTAVGLASAAKSRGTKADYYVASGSVAPWLVGLSAVATNNSGYMFIGVIGYTYSVGLPALWLMLGWIAGDMLASHHVHRKLRIAVGRSGAVTYPELLANWHGQNHKRLQRVMGLVSLLFLLTYASAQLIAGSKALSVLLAWPVWSGAVVGAVLVGAYSFAGGIRASIWTDAVQSVVMFTAMGVLLVYAINAAGGISQTLYQLQSIEHYLEPSPEGLPVGGWAAIALFTLGWFFAGASVIGQPQVMVRFFTLQDPAHMHRARTWYYLWFTGFYAMATGVGMLSRVLLPDTSSFDPELALPLLSQTLLSPVLVGLILAGIFSATLSTADSLLLSCSSAITHDLTRRPINNVRYVKLITAAVIVVSLIVALLNNDSVFSLVLLAWSGLASAFAPLLMFLAAHRKPTEMASLLAMAAGFGTAVLWRASDTHLVLYEGLPGVIIGLLVLAIAGRLQGPAPETAGAQPTTDQGSASAPAPPVTCDRD